MRPEKIRIADPGTHVDDDEYGATGTIRSVVYLGPDTRYNVALDAGGELVVTQQNLATSSMEALAQQGRAVRLVWKRQHCIARSRTPGRRATEQEEEREDDAQADPALWAAIAAIAVGACSGGAAARRRRRPAPTSIGPGEGELNLVIWTGYAERGASDPAYDWVTPFETETGCKVNTTDMTGLQQRRLAHAVGRATTASRRRATRPPA